MKTKSVAIFSLIAGSLFGVVGASADPMGLTRESVIQEYEKSKEMGALPSVYEDWVGVSEKPKQSISETAFDFDQLAPTAAGGLTREQVIHDYLKAKEEGSLPAVPFGGDGGPSE